MEIFLLNFDYNLVTTKMNRKEKDQGFQSSILIWLFHTSKGSLRVLYYGVGVSEGSLMK